MSVSTLIALAALFIFEFFPEAIINIFGQESDLYLKLIILIPAVLIFSYLWGIDGFLWAGPFGDGVSGIISLVTIWALWKKIFGNGGKENA